MYHVTAFWSLLSAESSSDMDWFYFWRPVSKGNSMCKDRAAEAHCSHSSLVRLHTQMRWCRRSYLCVYYIIAGWLFTAQTKMTPQATGTCPASPATAEDGQTVVCLSCRHSPIWLIPTHTDMMLSGWVLTCVCETLNNELMEELCLRLIVIAGNICW